MSEIDSYRFICHGKPLTQNQVRRMHFHQEAKEKSHWKGLFTMAIKTAKMPKNVEQIEIHITQYYKRGVPPDTDAPSPTAKVAIDALVHCGVIEDDDREHVPQVTYHAPIKAKVAGLEMVVILRPPPAFIRPVANEECGLWTWGKTTESDGERGDHQP